MKSTFAFVGGDGDEQTGQPAAPGSNKPVERGTGGGQGEG